MGQHENCNANEVSHSGRGHDGCTEESISVTKDFEPPKGSNTPRLGLRAESF